MSNYYLASQNKSNKYEFSHRILWSPQLTIDGKHNAGYDSMSRVKDGDIIFHVYGQHLRAISRAIGDVYEQSKPNDNSFQDWADLGWQVDCKMTIVNVSLKEHRSWFKSHEGGPFNKNGTLNQSYLLALTKEQTNYLLSLVNNKDSLIDLITADKAVNGNNFVLTKSRAPLKHYDYHSIPSVNKTKGTYKLEINEEKSRVGLLGEQAVINYLKNNYSSVDYLIEGLSSNLKSGGNDDLGYDIKLTNKNSKEIIYIDVKSTKGKSNIFYMSENERQAYLEAKRHNQSYLIYRVFDLDEFSQTGHVDPIDLTKEENQPKFQPVNYQVAFKF
ncbi:DUF3883 domain-containing protein [Oenococcus oeni]|uniref:DUF3883 domain-containing protein n=1 Tax=Oenococcus oeni TaxID=1247 RepID=UPI00067D2543|nr:DUF3883 domain-containing protein [Oenococcus oeni]SYW15380.1 conserved hypothetical protein [Oenococcus oeni]